MKENAQKLKYFEIIVKQSLQEELKELNELYKD